ncbi:hypothetical protein [Streptomyces noursei]|uniref:hypothetical protein n=1 Tax=Streptomyces noursei TaxID=1971 RepID=UPI00167A644C|nr:hypothetical protein [Streptomyces noursei]MCZ1021229.1 hypothetical protein [Streptomyces noursei]
MFAIRSLRQTLAMRDLHKRCRAQLAEVGLPEPFSIEGLVERIERARGRKIVLAPFEDHGSDMRTACGLRVKLPDATILLYRVRPTPLQTHHLVGHEIGHELLGHSTNLPEEQLHALLSPGLRKELRQRYGSNAVIQARGGQYDSAEEQEAEITAHLIQDLAGRCWGPLGDDVVSRLEHAFSHPVASTTLRRR